MHTLSSSLFIVLLLVGVVQSEVYDIRDEIIIGVGSVGPFRNPFETYNLFTKCANQEKEENMQTLLYGERALQSVKIPFGVKSPSKTVCLQNSLLEFNEGWIDKEYVYRVYVDGIEASAPLCKRVESQPLIYLHETIIIGINNKNQIINVTLSVANPVLLKADVSSYNFTVDVNFIQSERPHAILNNKSRSMSLINSALMVVIVGTIAALIVVRTLRKDFAKIEEEKRLRYEGHDTIDGSGWKQLYADVFRVPQKPLLLCAVVGSGCQLIIIVFAEIFGFAMSAAPQRVSFPIVTFTLTSCVTGYISAYHFMHFGVMSPPLTSHWIRCLVLSLLLLPALLLVCFTCTNIIAFTSRSTQTVYLAGIVYRALLWIFIGCPLGLIGTVVARYMFRRTGRRKDIPHVNQIPRLVPKCRKFTSPQLLVLISGIMPFATLFIEFRYIMGAFWLYKQYSFCLFFVLTLGCFGIVTMGTTIVASFILLSTENHRWRWTSFGFGSSFSIYIFLYAIYFYYFKSSMSGIFMFVFYFSYSIAFCVFCGCVGGTISYFTASTFVKSIYRQVKDD